MRLKDLFAESGVKEKMIESKALKEINCAISDNKEIFG